MMKSQIHDAVNVIDWYVKACTDLHFMLLETPSQLCRQVPNASFILGTLFYHMGKYM